MKYLGIGHIVSLFLLTIIFKVPNAQAQETQSFGIKGGLSLTTLSGRDYENIRPGLQVGAFTKFGGRESLFFKAELLATQKGSWNWNKDQPNNFSFYYVDLPLMFGINVFRSLSVNLGIQPSFLVAGTYRSSVEGSIETRSIGKDLIRFDYSTLAGLEYLMNENWLLGARFNYSFVPIQNYGGEFTINHENQLLSNRTLQFYVGYRLK